MNLVSETVFLLLTFASTSVCSVPEIIELDPISSVQNNSSLQLIDDPSLLIIPLKSGADTPEPLLVPEEVSESPPSNKPDHLNRHDFPDTPNILAMS